MHGWNVFDVAEEWDQFSALVSLWSAGLLDLIVVFGFFVHMEQNKNRLVCHRLVVGSTAQPWGKSQRYQQVTACQTYSYLQ